MPNPVPEFLDPEQAEKYTAIGSYVQAGVGADRVYRILRDEGSSLTRAFVRSVTAEIRETLGYRQQLAAVHLDNPIPNHLVSRDSHLKGDDYRHVLSMLVIDPETGYTLQKYATYVSPELATPNQVFEQFGTEDITDPKYKEFELVSQAIVAVGHRLGKAS